MRYRHTTFHRSAPRALPTALGIVLSALLMVAHYAPAAAQEVSRANAEPRGEGGYSVFRVLEGDVALIPGNDYGALDQGALDRNTRGASEAQYEDAPSGIGVPAPAQRYHPILPGDRVWSPAGGRVEILLSDLNILRLGAETEVVFDALAGTPEGSDDVTSLRLVEGEIQLLIFADAIGRALPTIATGNATIYLRDPGSYRVQASGWDFTRLTVRQGFAELALSGGSQLARSREEIIVDGAFDTYPRVRDEGSQSDLERWGDELERDARGSYLPTDELDGALAYAAEPLDDHGQWVEVDTGWAWRPQVAVGWQPYWDGRWVYTPAGMHWVSYEPWGHITSHYGSWRQAGHHGWLWYPGRQWAPARVHWYWGDGYAAWYPSGHWNSYYGNHHPRYAGYDYGIYGWGGGSWNTFLNWSWCPTRYLGHRQQRRHHAYGRNLRHDVAWREVPRGIITTDTRDFTPDRWRNPERRRDLMDRRGPRGGDARSAERQLVDVTPYLRRDTSLSDEVQRAVLAPPGAGGRVVGRTGSSSGDRAEASRGGASQTTESARRVQAIDRTGASRFERSGERRPAAPTEALRRTAGRGGSAAEVSSPGESRRGNAGTATRQDSPSTGTSTTPRSGTLRSETSSRSASPPEREPRRESTRSSGSSSTQQRRATPPPRSEPRRESTRSSGSSSTQQRRATPPPRSQPKRESTRSSGSSSTQQRRATPPPRSEPKKESTRSSNGSSGSRSSGTARGAGRARGQRVQGSSGGGGGG